MNDYDLDDMNEKISKFIENDAFDVICERCDGKHGPLLSVPHWGEYYHKECLELKLVDDYEDIFED